jgi:tetratricopeptide (TPR) repeat protein
MNFLSWLGKKLSLQPARVESPRNVPELLQEAHALLLVQKYDEARTPLLKAIQSRESINEPEAINYILMSLGITWILTDRYDEGIAFFSEYICNHPTESVPYRERASCFWYKGHFQEAIRDYSQALELKPGDILSLSGRGQTLAEAGDYVRAMPDLNLALVTLQAVSMQNNIWKKWCEEIEAFVHNGKGVALAGLGAGDSAMAEFELSIKMSSENAWVYHNRAQVHDRADNLDLAREDYQKALDMKNPALSPRRKSHAQARLRELLNHS